MTAYLEPPDDWDDDYIEVAYCQTCNKPWDDCICDDGFEIQLEEEIRLREDR